MRFFIRLPMRQIGPCLALATVCLMLSTAAHAQWKWRDKTGQVNASDRPPPKDVPDKDIISRPSPDARRVTAANQAASGSGSVASAPPALPAAGKGPLDREVEARKKASDQEQAAKSRADEERVSAQRAENCRRARGQLAALESGQRMARVNDKGEREVLDDKGRAEEMRQARDVVASDCK